MGPDYIDVILFCFFKNCIEKTQYLKDLFIESAIHEIFQTFKIKTYCKSEKINSNKKNNDNKRVIIVIDGSLYKEKTKCK